MRIRTEEESVVRGSPADVYEVVADIRRRPRWLTELDAVDAPPGVAHAGTRFAGESHMFLHRFRGVSEVVVAEPHTQLVEEVYIGAHFRSTWTFDDAGDGHGTRIRHRIDLEFPNGPIGSLARWLLHRRLRRMNRASFKELDRVLRVP